MNDSKASARLPTDKVDGNDGSEPGKQGNIRSKPTTNRAPSKPSSSKSSGWFSDMIDKLFSPGGNIYGSYQNRAHLSIEHAQNRQAQARKLRALATGKRDHRLRKPQDTQQNTITSESATSNNVPTQENQQRQSGRNKPRTVATSGGDSRSDFLPGGLQDIESGMILPSCSWSSTSSIKGVTMKHTDATKPALSQATTTMLDGNILGNSSEALQEIKDSDCSLRDRSYDTICTEDESMSQTFGGSKFGALALWIAEDRNKTKLPPALNSGDPFIWAEVDCWGHETMRTIDEIAASVIQDYADGRTDPSIFNEHGYFDSLQTDDVLADKLIHDDYYWKFNPNSTGYPPFPSAWSQYVTD